MMHNLYLDVPECFIVFNDADDLTFDPISAADLTEVSAVGKDLASIVWSAFCRWYFVVEPQGIFLFNIDGSGWFCRKRSARFIELYLQAPKGRRA